MKVLVLKLSSLGDIIHALPVLNAIKLHKPEAQIDWLVKKGFEGILKNQQSLNKLHVLEGSSLGDYISIIRKLRSENYDLIIDLQGLMKTALIGFFASKSNTKKSPHGLVGFSSPREPLAGLLYKTKVDAGRALDRSMHIVDKNLQIAKVILGSDNLDVDFSISSSKMLDHCASNSNPNFKPSSKETPKVCLIPCTTWESKLWYPDYWANLVNAFIYNYSSEVHILGSKSDNPYIEKIISLSNPEIISEENLINSAGKFKLDELPSFFQSMDIIVGVDTGPLHIAAASVNPERTRILGLYGPTSARRSGPYGFEAISYDEISGSEPSNKKSSSQDGHSMSAIMVADVFRKASSLLALKN